MPSPRLPARRMGPAATPAHDGAALLDRPRVEAFFRAARDSGCPADQVENFLRAGVVLQPKQCVASAVARLCDLPGGPIELAYGGARGGGKSHWMLAQIVEDCLRYPGLKCLMLRKVGSAGREGFEDLLPKVLAGVAYRYVPSSNALILANGSRIRLGHFKDEKDVDRYLGLEYDVVGVEEATTLSAAKYRAIQTCNRTSKPGWRPRIYSTTNPGGIGHDWYKRRFIDPFLANAEATTRFVPATVDDNAFVNPEYRGILDSLTGWQLRAWRFGDWDIAAGQFFSTWSRAHHVVGEVRIGRDWDVWLALDHGFIHDTYVVLMAQDAEGDVFAADEHCRSRTLVEAHAEAVAAMLERNGIDRGRLKCFVAGRDVWSKERDGGTVADDYRSHGWELTPANTDRVNGAAEILRRLGDPARDGGKPPSVFVAGRCRKLIECLPAMIHDPHRPEDVLKVDADDDGAGGDDAYDGFRYGLQAARKAPPPRLRRVPGRRVF